MRHQPCSVLSLNFNPRSPCGERRLQKIPHRCNAIFQSTLPVWGATCGFILKPTSMSISIHAPRVGSDRPAALIQCVAVYISIHAPRVGSDPLAAARGGRALPFQSTLPVWGATFTGCGLLSDLLFQSTLPVWGATDFFPVFFCNLLFQSTLPVWGATR